QLRGEAAAGRVGVGGQDGQADRQQRAVGLVGSQPAQGAAVQPGAGGEQVAGGGLDGGQGAGARAQQPRPQVLLHGRGHGRLERGGGRVGLAGVRHGRSREGKKKGPYVLWKLIS